MEENSTVKTRLAEFLKARRITKSSLSRMLDVSPAYVSAMRKSIPEEKVKKLCELFPELNRDWLLYGEGNMLRDPDPHCDINDYEVPLLPVEAFAGGLQSWSKGVELRDCERVISPVPGADYAIRITGNSMEPEFHSGSVLLIRKINDRAFIPWGNPMVIDSENGVLIKAVYPADSPGEYIEARSYNPLYPPIRIPTESIFGLYRIVGDMRQFNTM